MAEQIPLFPHQEEAVTRYMRQGYFGAWHDTGTGKTRTAVECIKAQARVYDDLRAVIFTPNTVQDGWVANFDKFYPDRRFPVTVLRGSGAKKALMVRRAEKSHVFVVNYEALDNEDLLDAIVNFKADIKISDEVHRIKNPSSTRSKFGVKLDTPHAIALTGTLESNGYQDIYMPFRFLNKDIFPYNYNVFQRTFFYNENADKPWLNFPSYVVKPDSVNYFQKLKLELGTVVKKNLTLTLPPLLEQIHYVELHRNVLRAYKDMEKDFVAWFDSPEGRDAVSAQLAITKSLRLQQIASGVLQGDNTVECVHQEKDAALMELVSDLCPQNKVIIWCNFRPSIDRIKKLLLAMGLYDRNISVVRGGQSHEERREELRRFINEMQCSVMIANPKAGGTGIDGLQVANYAIYYDKSFSYIDYQQSLARTYRAGSERHESVTVIHLITRGTIEELIHETLQHKDTLQDYDVARILRERYAKKGKRAA